VGVVGRVPRRSGTHRPALGIARCDRHSHGKIAQAMVRVTTMRTTGNAQTRDGCILGGREGHKTRNVFFDTI
jgi:hypothetical protein